MAKQNRHDDVPANPDGWQKRASWDERLEVHLDDYPRDAERVKALTILRDLDRLEEQRKEVAAKIKADIQAKKSDLLDARNAAERGWVMRDVTVERMIDRHGKVIETRVDTGALVRERMATAEERQEYLVFTRRAREERAEAKQDEAGA
jgi:hypothetical protein